MPTPPVLVPTRVRLRTAVRGALLIGGAFAVLAALAGFGHAATGTTARGELAAALAEVPRWAAFGAVGGATYGALLAALLPRGMPTARAVEGAGALAGSVAALAGLLVAGWQLQDLHATPFLRLASLLFLAMGALAGARGAARVAALLTPSP